MPGGDLTRASLRPGQSTAQKPPWLRVRLRNHDVVEETRTLVRDQGLNTVCEEAACPNLPECWSKRHATVMILGSICTRACSFCNVATGRPGPVDDGEPTRLAQTVSSLNLAHVVITSVDRDDLPDGGASQFVACIEAIRSAAPETTIEILTPDFRRQPQVLDQVMEAGPDVFNHNLETVPSLYRQVRPGASYEHSLSLLKKARFLSPRVFTKSGIMLGLGETRSEVLSLMDDLRRADVDFLTVGQYLRPTPRHIPVARYVEPAEFEAYAHEAEARGFSLVSASPLTRSSYHAGDDFRKLRAARDSASRERGSVRI
ncbi:MAG: lipoyl synthase [Myxococcota bacterium]|nr:lipoyl synthase [Myxococcota bacterium]